MRRRNRRKTRKSVGLSSPGSRTEVNSQMRVTPPNLTPLRTTRWQPVRRLVSRDPQPRTSDPAQVAGATNVHEFHPACSPRRLSSPSLLSVPSGLSPKELARLRAETLPSPPRQALQDSQSGQPEGVSGAFDVHEPPLSPLLPLRRPPSPSMSSAPIGLSAKELARLRAETLPSPSREVIQASQSGQPEGVSVAIDVNEAPLPPLLPLQRPPSLSTSSAPIDLSDGELARLRAETLRPLQISVHNESTEPQLEPVTAPAVTADPEPGQDAAIPSSDTRELRSVVESLQREVQRLRTERFDAPPSYTEAGR